MSYYDWIGFTDETHQPLGPPTIEDASQCSFFLGFDGTLVENAETPDRIKIDPGLTGLLNRLYDRSEGRTAVISGRPLSELRSFVSGFKGPLIGSYGAEKLLDGQEICHPAARSEELASMRKAAAAYVEAEPSVLMEDKAASFVLNFRRSPEKMANADLLLTALVGHCKGWHLQHENLALEVIHDDVSKGAAILPYVQSWQPAKPVAIGGDSTDETMFSVVQDEGGIGIKVGVGCSNARHSLFSVNEVRDFLKGLAEG